MNDTPTPDNAARATPVAWAMTDYQADGANTQYTRDSHAAEYWGSQGIQVDPLFDAATVAALEAEVERLRSALNTQVVQTAIKSDTAFHAQERADAAERRVAELTHALSAARVVVEAEGALATLAILDAALTGARAK